MMVKKLSAVGNSLGLIIERPILELLDITKDTPLEIRTHSAEPVPFVIYDNKAERQGAPVSYDEAIAQRHDAPVFEEGYTLMDHFLRK